MNSSVEPPKIIIIAGANGAGKTTFAKEFLPHEAHCPTFINADLIAAGLAPFAPETAAIQAGRIMLEMIDNMVQHRKSFAIETTLSGKGYASKIPQWQALGYQVKLIFLQLPNEETAMKRVANRVAHGGPQHSIRCHQAAICGRDKKFSPPV
jgi:predicted ABC-type ATPase